MVKRSFKILAELVAVIVAGLTVLLIAAAVKLSAGPISLDFLTPHIERGLNTEDGDFKVNLGGTVLAWSKADRDLDIVLRDVRVTNKEGAGQALVPQLAIGLSVRALLVGEFRPTRFELFGPTLRLVRGPDGTIAFGDAGRRNSAADQDAGLLGGPLTSTVVESLLSVPPAGHPLHYLRDVRFTRATLEFEDQANGFTLTSPGSELILIRNDDGIAVSARLHLTVDGESAPVDLTGGYNTAAQKARMTARFRNLGLGRFAKLSPALSPLAAIQFPADGKIGVTMDSAGRIGRVSLDITGGPGDLVLEAVYPDPVRVRAFRIKASAWDGFSRFDIDHLNADLGGARIGVTGKGAPSDQGTQVALEITARDVTVARLKSLWPKGAAEGARAWITENLNGGTIGRADAKLALNVAAGEAGMPESADVTALDGGFDFTGVTIHYLKPLPPIRSLSGRAKLTKDAFVIEEGRGETQGITLEDGSVNITDLDKETRQTLQVNAVLRGPLSAGLTLLAHPRLDLIKGFGIAPASVKGDMATRLAVKLPLLKNLTFDMVDVGAASNLKGVAIPKVALDSDLTEGDLTLQVDKKGMDVSGAIRLGGVPANLAWTENFYEGAQFRGRYQVTGEIDDAGRKTLGLESHPHVSGPLGFDLVITRFDKTRTGISGTLDVTPAKLDFSEIEWAKQPGTKGSAGFTLNLIEDKPREIPRLIVKAGDLDAEGAVRLKPDGITVESFEFSKLIFGESDITVSGKARSDGGLNLSVGGNAIDVRPFLESRGKQGAKRPLMIEVDIARARVGPGPVISEVSGSLSRTTGDWRNMSITGVVGKDRKPVLVSIKPMENARELVITSNDAGATLKSFDITDDMVGGELSIKGTYDDTKPDSPLTGTFLVRQFQMVRAPLMARLLGILSLDGIVSTLSGKGIAFDELVAPFTKTGDDLRIKNAKAYGSALGFTASGWMDLEQDKLDISGTVVPAYTINKILGWIPLLGDVLVGEKGSGVFAATYRMHGPFSDPKVSTNPLATFAPGALRELLGIFDSRREKPPSERKQTGAPPVTKSRPEAPEDTAPLGRVDR